ncbi:MAG: glycosyltransferase family 2 protein [Fimbriiglobus sp.]
MPAHPPQDPTRDLDLELAHRRIEQLESALMRRTELLEQRQAELANIKASRAYKIVALGQKVFHKAFPLHTRRRAYARSGVRSAGHLAKWVLNRRAARNGPSPEERHLAESTPPGEYRRWISRWEPKAAELATQRQHRFGQSPTISVVVPVFNPPARFLELMIRSVLDQTYSRWELCLADASTAPHVRPILERAAAADPRVKVAYLPENLGIAGNSNAALALAVGEFVSLLDHDDTLAPFALHEVVTAINAHADADFLYSDEDKLDPTGERVEPNFKPDWSPETIRSRNYVCHLTVLRKALTDDLGGFRPGFDGSQDYDLVLRASETARRIVHIPRVLYHWRMHEQSTALNKGSKNYAYENGRNAIADHLARIGVDAGVHDGPVLGTYQVVYHLRSQPLVSVVVPNKDHPEMLARCVDSLAKGSYANYELLVVENGSTRPETFALYERLKAQPHVRIVEWKKPFNYAAVNNFAAAQARGDLLLFLNNDVEAITPDWLESLVKLAVQPGVGAVGAKLYFADDTIQHAGIVVGMGGVAGHGFLNFPRQAAGYMQRLLYTQNVAAVTGACLLMPRPVFDAVGGFDEGFVLAFNDVDICLQVLRRGYRVVWTPDAELYHLESKTRGYEDTPEKQARFKREVDLFHSKWTGFLRAGDPYYSPHFRLDRPDFALKAA